MAAFQCSTDFWVHICSRFCIVLRMSAQQGFAEGRELTAAETSMFNATSQAPHRKVVHTLCFVFLNSPPMASASTVAIREP
jgi:hypothetical protein